MPSIECARCHSHTNTAVCEWLESRATGKAQGCYVKWVTDHWEPGCLYLSASPLYKHIADDMIAIGADWGKHTHPTTIQERSEPDSPITPSRCLG